MEEKIQNGVDKARSEITFFFVFLRKGTKMPYPELDEKESIVWPFVKKVLQASFLLWELVIDLPNIHRL